MVRKLKYHEKKLLKKVDFISWEVDNNLEEVRLLRRYHIQKRSDYVKYKKLARHIRDLARQIKELDPKDPFRTESSATLLDKLYNMGLIPTKRNLILCDKVTGAAFCRRRLPVTMVRQNMSQTIKDATRFVEQGHIRVGPEIVMDPAFLISRPMEDFITWVDASAIRRHVQEYNELRDDFDM